MNRPDKRAEERVRHKPAMLLRFERLFYARCRMEPAWRAFDFAVDISDWYERKRAAIAAYASVFEGDQARLLERHHDPTAFAKVSFG